MAAILTAKPGVKDTLTGRSWQLNELDFMVCQVLLAGMLDILTAKPGVKDTLTGRS